MSLHHPRAYHHGYRPHRPDPSAEALADGLGWFSIGLGAAELLAPQALGRALGMEDRASLIRAYGLREIVTGIGILSQDDPAPWMWGRVAGDVLDLATLASGLHPANPARGRVGFAIGAVAAVAVLDAVCADALSADRRLPYTPSDDELWDDQPWDGHDPLDRPPYDPANP